MDLDEADHGLSHYHSFAELFTRRLKTGARPLDVCPKNVACPVDGRVNAVGLAKRGELLQAKGISYSLSELLAERQLAERLTGGFYLTVYLRPRDYHRIHAPWDAELVGFRRIPGSLYPVQPVFVRNVPALFARNERVVMTFETRSGVAALVCVGAAAVGSVGTPFTEDQLENTAFKPIPVSKGDEVGVFRLGSTVVLIHEAEHVSPSGLNIGDEVRVGQMVASFRS